VIRNTYRNPKGNAFHRFGCGQAKRGRAKLSAVNNQASAVSNQA
jgi:hypothetical protein